MKNSEEMTLSDYIQHAHILIDRFAVEYRKMNDDEPDRFPLKMSKEAWNDEFLYSSCEW